MYKSNYVASQIVLESEAEALLHGKKDFIFYARNIGASNAMPG